MLIGREKKTIFGSNARSRCLRAAKRCSRQLPSGASPLYTLDRMVQRLPTGSRNRLQRPEITGLGQRNASSLAPHHGLGEAGRLGHHFVSLGYPNDFFDRGFAFHHAAPAILSQGQHALVDGGLL